MYSLFVTKSNEIVNTVMKIMPHSIMKKTVESNSDIAATVTPGSASVDQLAKALNSSASGEAKTNYLIQYLMAQRDVLMDFGKTVLFALIVYLIGKKIVKLCLKLTNKWMERKNADEGVRNFVMSFANVGYHLVLLFLVAGILGVGATIAAVVASAGLTIGLALQGSLSNLAGGVLLLLLKPFKVGDYIITTGVEGTVDSIDVFYTRISTTDNKIVVIPNGTLTNSNITNTTNASERMLILDFMVPYDVDIAHVRNILMPILKENSKVFQNEKMDVVISKYTPLKICMQLKAWVKTEDYWDVRYEILEEIKLVLQQNGIWVEK